MHLHGLPTAARCGLSSARPPGDPALLQVLWVRVLGSDPRGGMHQQDKACKTICKIIPFSRQRNTPWQKAGDGLHCLSSPEVPSAPAVIPSLL